MFTYRGKTFYIDPLFDGTSYAVYTQQESWRRLDDDEVLSSQLGAQAARSVLVSGNQRKRYTIASRRPGNIPSFTVAPKPQLWQPLPPCLTESTRSIAAM